MPTIAAPTLVSRSMYAYLNSIPGPIPAEVSPGRPIPNSTADASGNPCRPCGEGTVSASGAVSGNPNDAPLVNPLGQRPESVAPSFAMSFTGEGGSMTTEGDCGCDKPFDAGKDWWKVLAGAVAAWLLFR